VLYWLTLRLVTRKFLFCTNGENEPPPVRHRALVWEMDDFEPEDIARISGHYLGQANDQLDFDKIHRFAPALNGYQIKNACLWLANATTKLLPSLISTSCV